MEHNNTYEQLLQEHLATIARRVKDVADCNPGRTILGISRFNSSVTASVPAHPGEVIYYRPDIPCAVYAVLDMFRKHEATRGRDDFFVATYNFDLREFYNIAFNRLNQKGVLEYDPYFMDPEQYLSWCVHGMFNNTKTTTVSYEAQADLLNK